jgi:hypothetical protein
MLLSSLVLMFVACPAQDPAAAPAQDAAPAVATEAQAAPTETSESVRAFLTEAQNHLYDPQAAGLRSLAFDLDVEMPKLGPLGSVHVTWTAGEPARTDFTAAPTLAAALPKEMAEAQSSAMAQQLLGGMLNRPLASLLDGGVATMGGVQEGLVAVNHHHPVAAAQGVKSQVYLFDEEGLLKKSATVMEQAGQSATITQTYSWRPAAEGTDLLVAVGQSVEATIPTPMGDMTQTSNASFTYIQVGAIVLPVQIAMSSQGPMSGDQVLKARNLFVNGEAAPTPTGVAPDEAAPAAPRMPDGG